MVCSVGGCSMVFDVGLIQGNFYSSVFIIAFGMAECWLGVLMLTFSEHLAHAFIAFYGTRVVLRQILRARV